MMNKNDNVKTIEELSLLNTNDETMIKKVLTDNDAPYIPNKTQVTVVEQVIKNADGTEMFKYLGSNATTMGGTQTIVENIFANILYDQLTEVETLDRQIIGETTGENPVTWSLDLAKGGSNNINKELPRKIFGIMIADDGAVGNTVKVVNRREKGFDPNHLVPFLRHNLVSDNAREFMLIGDPNATTAPEVKHYTDESTVRAIQHGITGRGKYAGRITMNGNESAYLIKLVKFETTNIMIDGTKIDENNLSDRRSLDVRTKVQVRINIRKDELSTSFNHGKLYGDKNIRNAMISSIMLVAGRPAMVSGGVDAGYYKILNYNDIIVTNRINFTELPIDETELNFRYTIYYV